MATGRVQISTVNYQYGQFFLAAAGLVFVHVFNSLLKLKFDLWSMPLKNDRPVCVLDRKTCMLFLPGR